MADRLSVVARAGGALELLRKLDASQRLAVLDELLRDTPLAELNRIASHVLGRMSPRREREFEARVARTRAERAAGRTS